MTEPKSISRLQSIYADQYGTPRPLNREQRVSNSYEDSVEVGRNPLASDPSYSEYQEFLVDVPEEVPPDDNSLLSDFERREIAAQLQGDAGPIEWGSEDPVRDPLALKREVRDLIETREGNDSVLEEAQRDGFMTRLERIFSARGTAEEKLEAWMELKDDVQGALQEAEDLRIEWPSMFASEAHAVGTQLSRMEDAEIIVGDQKQAWADEIAGIEKKLQKGQITIHQARNQLKELSDEINQQLRSDHAGRGSEREEAVHAFQRALEGLGATPNAGYSAELGRSRDGWEFLGTLFLNISTGFIPAMVEAGRVGENRGPDPVRVREFANAINTALLQEGDTGRTAPNRPIDPNDPTSFPNDRWSAVEQLLSRYGDDKFQYATALVMAIRQVAGSDDETKRLLNVLPTEFRNTLVTALNGSGKFLNDGSKTGGMSPSQASALISESLNDEEHRYYSQPQNDEAPQINYSPGADPADDLADDSADRPGM